MPLLFGANNYNSDFVFFRNDLVLNTTRYKNIYAIIGKLQFKYLKNSLIALDFFCLGLSSLHGILLWLYP